MRAPRPEPIGRQAPVPERLSGVQGLLVGTDFDGTLAPIDPDPRAPLATPENKRALRRLAAHPATVVAVISGRSLNDLRPRVGIEDLVYVGNHGLEIDRGGPPRVHPEAQARRGRVHEVCQAIQDAVADASGVHVEDKGLSATIHYRQATDAVRERLLEAARTTVEEAQDAVRLSPGKASLEVRPAVDWDKGSTIRQLASDAPDGWTTIYLGDDETDEDAFRALGPDGIGIHVGTRADTAADYRLPQQAQVAPFLNGLASEIHGRAVWASNGDASGVRHAEQQASEEP